MKTTRTSWIPSIAAVALACCWLSALSTARVSSNPGGAVAPAWAQTTSSAPASEKLDINTAPKDQLKTLPGIDGRPVSHQAGFGAQKPHFPRAAYDKIKEKIIAKQPKATGMAPTSPKEFNCVERCLAKAVAGMTRFRVRLRLAISHPDTRA